MDGRGFIADRKIEEAMEEGAFENLEGAGRPLNLDEDPFLDPAVRMAYRLLRNSGFTQADLRGAKFTGKPTAKPFFLCYPWKRTKRD